MGRAIEYRNKVRIIAAIVGYKPETIISNYNYAIPFDRSIIYMTIDIHPCREHLLVTGVLPTQPREDRPRGQTSS